MQLADALSEIFKRNMYSVDTVYNGTDGLDNALTGVYKIIEDYSKEFLCLFHKLYIASVLHISAKNHCFSSVYSIPP